MLLEPRRGKHTCTSWLRGNEFQIKGTIEKAGQIKGEIGTHIPAFDYKSLNPFAGFIKDGVHGSFDLRAGITDSYFCISVKGHAVIAQTNLPDKGHETTIFELEATVQGRSAFLLMNTFDHGFNVSEKVQFVSPDTIM